MKYFLLVLVLIISPDLYGQIGELETYNKITEVGKVERLVGNTYYALYTLSFVEVEKGKRNYILVFTNERTLYDSDVADTRSLSFMATQSEFDYLYDFLIQGFNEDQIRSLEVGQNIVKTLPLTSKFMYIYVDFKDGKSASLKLKKRQLAKLFGRK